MMLVRNLCSCRRLPTLFLSTSSVLSQQQQQQQQQQQRCFSVRARKDSSNFAPLSASAVGRTMVRYSSSTSNEEEEEVHLAGTGVGTVSDVEMEKFKTLAPQWWKNDGEYIALHSMNKLRVPLIKQLARRTTTATTTTHPLKGVRILDVGCGGGILSVPLARLGAHVVGIDPLQENIDAALAHTTAHKDLTTLRYECTTIEEFSRQHADTFDVVVASEVVEHVENPEVFVQDCCECVRGGGHMLCTTINRNILSTLLVKYAAEYVLRLVPPDTHDEGKFVEPGELVDMLRGGGMVGVNFRGMAMNPVTLEWMWTDSLLMNYACYATKPLV